jgi:hypothetical protein
MEEQEARAEAAVQAVRAVAWPERRLQVEGGAARAWLTDCWLTD